jgi:hypothetical protein
MAINKNFVIKHGIEVNGNAFVVDPDNNKVGINTALPDYELHVNGGIGVTDAIVSGVTTAIGDLLVGIEGTALAVKVSAGNSVGIGTDLPQYPLHVRGPASSGTIAEYVYGDLQVTGQAIVDTISINGTASLSGATNFTNTTDNTIGNVNTGAVQIDGGLGINKNVTIGAGLSVTGASSFIGDVGLGGTSTSSPTVNINAIGDILINYNANQQQGIALLASTSGYGGKSTVQVYGAGSSSEEAFEVYNGVAGAHAAKITHDGSATFANVNVGGGLSVTGNSYFVGVVTFAAGASGTIQLGDNANDNVEFQADVNSNIVPNTTSLFNLGSSSQEWRDLHLAGNAGIGSLSVTGISTFNADVDINADVDVTGNIGVGSLTVTGISTFVGLSTFNGGIAVLAGVSTFLGNVNADGGVTANTAIVEDLTDNRIVIAGVGGELEDDANLTFDGATLSVGVDLDVDGHTELDNVNVSGVSTFVGVSSFTNTTENTLGDANTGAIKVDGGMGIAGNVTVGGGLSVTGNSYFVGMVTFAAGTDGNITLGDTNTDNVIFNADVNSNITPNIDATYDLGSDTQQWRNFFAAGNAGIGSLSVSGVSTFTGTASFQHVTVAGVTTYTSDVDINGNLDVDGRTDLDDLVVTGVSTYSADLDINADIDVSGNAGVGSLDVVGISTFVGDVSIADKIVHTGDTNTAIRFPAADTFTVETAGEERLRVNSAGLVGIGTDNPGTKLDVQGGNWTNGDIVVGQLGNAGKISFRRGADGSAAAYLGYDGATNNNQVALAANSADGTILFKTNSTERLRITYDGSVGIGSTIPTGKLDVVGHTELDSLNVAGVSTFVGVSSFTNTTNNTLGDVDSGSVKFDGGLGIAGNVTVGGGLSVTGNSYFVGMVTFAAGTNGNITLGDNAGDNVVFNADVNSNFIPNTDNAYDLGSSSQQWRNLYVNGLSELDFVNVSAASTFAGTINANGRIIGIQTNNVIPFYYDNVSDFPSASTYHGAFAHAHNTGKAYFAHAGWKELVSKNANGVVGAGTEGYNVGVVTATNIDLNGDIDVDGHTELDNLNVSGVATFAQTGFTNIDVTGVTTTQTLHVGTGGTVLSVSADNATFAIGSATTTVTATMNGGAIPSIGLVIALGG